MFKVFEQYFVGGMDSFTETEEGIRRPRIVESDIDVVYDLVYKSRDEHATFLWVKRLAREVADRTDAALAEVVELGVNRTPGYSVVAAVNLINKDGYPYHSFFIEKQAY